MQGMLHSIEKISGIKILVIGDLMLDEYKWCDVKRISPEAPVPIASVVAENVYVGGAANVAQNMNALGATVFMSGVIGDDRYGTILKDVLKGQGIITDGVITEIDRTTTKKVRIVSGTQQMLRIDYETNDDVSGDAEEKLIQYFNEKIPACDAIVISDYCKGVLTHTIVTAIFAKAKQYKKRIFVDSKNKHFHAYKGAYLIKSNREEAENFSGKKFDSTYSNLSDVIQTLAGLFEAHIVITLGKDGMAYIDGDNVCRHNKVIAQQVFDVSGAGDTVLATLSAIVATGGTLDTAIKIANYAAGYAVSCMGTTACSADVLKDLIQKEISKEAISIL